MEEIVWKPSYSVGVPSLDEQHKQLVSMLNLLLSHSEATVRSEAISELLTRMTKYALNHFKTEEELMEKYAYPELSVHKQEHKTYRLKVAALCQETMDHKALVPEELRQYLMGWWINHILKTDMKYRSFFMERGVT
ncbi:MAG: bacteriohemerythrin [Nitrospiraceae bacterium]|nr:bacteriohemerythrin [Nitrospiraceae bacterium]